jgi:hypothetical protein
VERTPGGTGRAGLVRCCVMTNPSPTDLTITAKSIPLGVWVTPRAEINGYPVALNWGVNHIPAQPGVHNVHVYMPWMWRYGKADITIDNQTAPAPPVYYAVPWTTFSKGAIGLQPVSNPGLLSFILVFLVPLLLVVLCCVGAAVLGN